MFIIFLTIIKCQGLIIFAIFGVLQDAGTDLDLVSMVGITQIQSALLSKGRNNDLSPSAVSAANKLVRLLLLCSRMNKNPFLFSLNPPTFRNSSLLSSGAGVYLSWPWTVLELQKFLHHNCIVVVSTKINVGLDRIRREQQLHMSTQFVSCDQNDWISCRLKRQRDVFLDLQEALLNTV